jgi:hypothetical protein
MKSNSHHTILRAAGVCCTSSPRVISDHPGLCSPRCGEHQCRFLDRETYAGLYFHFGTSNRIEQTYSLTKLSF